MNRIRMLLADDHALLRETLKLFLRAQPDLEVVGEAGTADEALQKAVPACPDVILLDISMPGKSGIAILPQIRKRCPDSHVIMVTDHDEPSYLRAALAAGATGYVSKSSMPAVLLEAIRAVRRNETYIDPSLRHIPIDRTEPARGPATAPLARLSERELQVLKLLAQGMRYQSIADQIGVSVKTVETYRSRLKAKLGFTNRADMVRLALESGILTSPE